MADKLEEELAALHRIGQFHAPATVETIKVKATGNPLYGFLYYIQTQRSKYTLIVDNLEVALEDPNRLGSILVTFWMDWLKHRYKHYNYRNKTYRCIELSGWEKPANAIHYQNISEAFRKVVGEEGNVYYS